MSKLLSYFFVENKDSSVLFKKSVSQKPASSTTGKGNPSQFNSSNNQIQNKNKSKFQKSDSKKQLKLTQLIFNQSASSIPSSTLTIESSKNTTTALKNTSNLIQQYKSTQIPLQSQVNKQNIYSQLQQETSPICSFTFELKGGIPRQTQPQVNNQKQKVLSQKQEIFDYSSFYASPQKNQYKEIESQLSSDSPFLSNIFTQVTNKISNTKRKADPIVSEFGFGLSKKRNIPTELQDNSQISPDFLCQEEFIQNNRSKKNIISFLSQEECVEESEDCSQSNDLFQNMKDLFTCTETLQSPTLEESFYDDNDTQTSQKSSKNKQSLKNRLKQIDNNKNSKVQQEDPEESSENAKFETEQNYYQEYLENLIQLEKDYSFDYNVFENSECQIDLKDRCIVINWVFDLCADFNLTRQTCQSAINLFDRYFTKKYSQISKQNIQLVAATCVYISSKKEEQICPKLKDFINSTKSSFTSEQFLTQELDILNTLNFKINCVCFEEWLHNICSRWDEYISKNYKNQQSIIEENSIIYFAKQTQDSKLRYQQLQKLIDLMQLDEEMNKFEKHVIVLAIIYISYGIQSKDFLLDDVINYFQQISMFYQKDYFQTYNQFIQSFQESMFIPNTRTSSSNLNQETFIQAIQFASKFFGYFKNYSSQLNLTEQNGRQSKLENGFQLVYNIKQQQQQKQQQL